MPFVSEWDDERRVEVLPSTVSELSWLQHDIGHGGPLPESPRLAALREAEPALRGELATLWQDGCGYLPEAAILAERLGVLLGDHADAFLQDLERAVHSDAAGLELLSERPGDREATIARLDRLRRDRALRTHYRSLSGEIWDLAREEWEAAGRQIVEQACRDWSERLGRGAGVRDLCPPNHCLNRQHQPDLAPLLSERPRVVVTPLYFCRKGGFLVDMTTYVHVGAPAMPVQTDGLRRQESELLAGRLKVLSDGTRLALLRQLVEEPASVMDLARRFRLAQPTVSNHVRLLRDAGLLDAQRDGARVVYTAPRDRLSRLLADAQGSLLGPGM
jgi:ArsR family transcriptional regulator